MHKPLVGINEPWMIVNNWKFTVPQLFFVNKFGSSMVLKQSTVTRKHIQIQTIVLQIHFFSGYMSSLNR